MAARLSKAVKLSETVVGDEQDSCCRPQNSRGSRADVVSLVCEQPLADKHDWNKVQHKVRSMPGTKHRLLEILFPADNGGA